MKETLLVLGAIIILAVVIGVIIFGVLVYRDPARGMQMLGGLAMFVRSIRKKPEKERPHRHQREGDETPREHRRKTPANPPTIRMFATPVPQRRRSDPKTEEPEE